MLATEVTGDSATNLDGKVDQLDHLRHHLARAYKSVGSKARKVLTEVLRVAISANKPLLVHSLAMLLRPSCDEVHSALSSVHSLIPMPKSREDGIPTSCLLFGLPH